MTRKTPIKHTVRTHIRKRKNGLSYAKVNAYSRGAGMYSPPKPRKGTPAYLSDRPSPSEVLKAGYGVGARVQLVVPQTDWSGKRMDEKFAHPVGSRGTVVGHFGAHPTVRWDNDKSFGSGGQVVEAKKLKVIGKGSTKKDVIATVGYEKLQEAAHKWGTNFEELGDKITLYDTKPVMDDNGFIVGDVTYKLSGRKVGNKVEFDTPKIDLSSVPRSQRWSQREYWESSDPKDFFMGVFD